MNDDKQSELDVTGNISSNISYSSYDISSDKRIFREYQQITRGPLPPADELVKYNSVISDGANRIMEMAEKEQQARIEWNRDYFRLKRLGQWFAFLLVVSLITLGTIFAFTGHEVLSYIMFGSLGGVALAAVFLGQFIKVKDKK